MFIVGTAPYLFMATPPPPSGMPRPKLTEDTYDRLADLVDARTKVPADHLTTDEKVAFLLNTLEEVEARNARLADRVDSLEDELEAARADSSDSDPTRDLDAIADADLPNGFGPGRR